MEPEPFVLPQVKLIVALFKPPTKLVIVGEYELILLYGVTECSSDDPEYPPFNVRCLNTT